ncbi:unnamed protein product [Mesocestoides corti]|uniref:G_PROTEIN_RECEP_F1_2 domain-containing protein n=1 Tax=Mesocestoides corti TaxID=53468 RepID=A0A0R3U9M7_MESCO|nr:unnamed protein product [Mesocestoides corti]
MQSNWVVGTFLVILNVIRVSCGQDLASKAKTEGGDWLPTDISLAYLNWIKERRGATSLSPPSADVSIVSTTSVPVTHASKLVYRSSNMSDLLSRYRETERLQRGKPITSHFNTPISATTTTSSLSDAHIPSAENEESPKAPTYGRVSAGIIILLTIVASSVTIGGNVLVLLAFYLERTLRMPTNYFIASLAVTDVLIGIFSMNLYSLYLLLGYWPLGRILCDLWLALDYTLCLTSQYTVLFITLDRFFSVKIPAKYRNWRTGNKVLSMIAITWILPSSIFFTTIIGWPYFSKYNHVRQSGTCYAEFSSNPMFNTILTISYFWLTLSVMTGLYIGIYLVALRLQKKSDEKRAKVKTLAKISGQNATGTGTESRVNNTEVEFGESYHLGSSNGTGAPPTSCEYDSGTNAVNDIRQSTKFPPDKFKEDMLPYCGPVPSQDKPPAAPATGALPCNTKKNAVYTNDCFSDSTFCPVADYSPKASPTSIAETLFADIRSPHLSDPEIVEGEKSFEQDLFSFPSSPAVHAFSDPESSCGTNNSGSSLKLSLAYSQDLAHHSDNSSLAAEFEGSTYPEQSYSCRNDNNRPTLGQNFVGNRHSSEDNTLQVCPFLDTDPPPSNVESRRISKTTAAKVAQIWQDRLSKQKQQQQQDQKLQEYHNQSTGNHLRTTSTDSRDSTNDGRAAITSNTLPRARKRAFYFASYFHKSRSTNVGVKRQVPMERGRTANRARKALKTISFILGAFVICWIPYHIVILIKGFCDDPGRDYTCVNHHLYSVTYWMCYMNSPINPFCYALANAQFKQAFLRILRLDLKRR